MLRQRTPVGQFDNILRLQDTADPSLASAQGVQAQARMLGGNLGLAVATIVLNAWLDTDLSGVLTPHQLSELKRSLNSIGSLTAVQVAAVGRSFADAFRLQLLVCLGVALASLLSCALVWKHRSSPSKVPVVIGHDLEVTERRPYKSSSRRSLIVIRALGAGDPMEQRAGI